MLGTGVTDAARAHALAEHPHESCGVVVGGRYIPVTNSADEPCAGFVMPPSAWIEHGPVEAVLHSHTDGSDWPSAADMRGQIASAVPWGIVVTDGRTAASPFWWGDGVQTPPLVGRPFRHGVTDCYSLIRDWYRLERDILLPDFPRDPDWWLAGGDLYRDGFPRAGFVQLPAGAAHEPGDVFLGALRGRVPHHGGIWLGHGLILHHLERRLSRREPLGGWRKFVTHWLRHAP
ncbi:MAG: C40 family peptidase [Alphaproteobacteria bacterium]